jgi:hypothetical protein
LTRGQVEYLVSKKANVTARDRWGGYPLKDAIAGGHTAVVEILAAANVSLPPSGPVGQTRAHAHASRSRGPCGPQGPSMGRNLKRGAAG